MRQYKKLLWALGLAACLVQAPVFADATSDINALTTAWEKARFQEPEAQKARDMDALVPKAEALAKHYPNDPKALVIAALVYGDKAKIMGGLGALPYLKTARSWYEHAIKLDPRGDDGQAQTLLGVFYYKIPGWPIAFGDNDKAREYLQAAIKINPKNIEAHYFYGDFLRLQEDYEGAHRELNKALQLPTRPEYSVRDEGRKREAKEILQEMKNDGH